MLSRGLGFAVAEVPMYQLHYFTYISNSEAGRQQEAMLPTTPVVPYTVTVPDKPQE